MEDMFFAKWRLRRIGKAQAIIVEHYYHVEFFYTVVDMQLQELNDYFTDTNTQLLLCMTCLNPTNLFSTFDKERQLEVARFYPYDFSSIDLVMLDNQLLTYIIDIAFSAMNYEEYIGCVIECEMHG